MSAAIHTTKPLFTGAHWDFSTLRDIYDACEEIAVGELGLKPYTNRIEVITSEQMLDAYTSHGLPSLYRHWSFGRRFARDEALYRAGAMGLAYEIVINSEPCIAYLMEENSAAMQALVIAHACFGHSHFFRNNRLFQDWTDAQGILDYVDYARRYIAECEEKHGVWAVERILDAAHSLQNQGIFTYPRRVKRLKEEEHRLEARRAADEAAWNPLWTTLPGVATPAGWKTVGTGPDEDEKRALTGMQLPEENLLYLIEKHAPRLKPWEREVVRIVRTLAQYFYPQRLTKLMNEGCATWSHYTILSRLHEKGLIEDGTWLEILRSHTAVAFQPEANDRRFSGWNPYALGYAIMEDIERICRAPDAEDRAWFPDFAGNGDPYGTLRHAWAEYRDESFVRQYLSPKVIRRFRMALIEDRRNAETLQVSEIHDETGYREIRSRLADTYDPSAGPPAIEASAVDILGNRRLTLTHRVRHGKTLDPDAAAATLSHLHQLWGYDLLLREIDATDEGTIDLYHYPMRGARQ